MVGMIESVGDLDETREFEEGETVVDWVGDPLSSTAGLGVVVGVNKKVGLSDEIR